jgi:hypothetical protein
MARDKREGLETEGLKHRVDKVPGFLSSRPNWVHPPPHPQSSVAPPPPPWLGGGGTKFGRWGQALWYSRYNIIPLYSF